MRSKKVVEALASAATVREAIAALRTGKKFKATLRRQFVAGHLETCIEHHRAIDLLIRHELIGSAFVLLRTIADSTLRALKVNKCATDAQVAAIYAEEEKTFPAMREMATAIDRNYEA
jgi:succinate dehydrogenase/fumarate reductase flavoprotein subunit